MIYTVAEVAKLVNLSKASIYVRMKTNSLKEHIVKKQGINYIDEEGFKLITDDIKGYKDKKTNNASNDEIATDTSYINCLNETVKYQKEQLNVKDQLIFELNERLKQSLELHKNTQILFKEQQPQDQLLLEEHFQDLDAKLEEVKNKMSDRKEKQENKSFFTKIFKGKD